MDGIEIKELEALISKATEGRIKGLDDAIMAKAKAMVEAVEQKSVASIAEVRKLLDDQADKHRGEIKRLLAYREDDGFDQGHSRRRVFPSSKMAAEMGFWALAAFTDNKKAKEICEERGIELKAMTEGDSSSQLVPIRFINAIQVFQETFGVMRGNARIVPIAEGGASYPKLTNELEVFHPSEGDAPMASDLEFGLNTLKPKDYATLVEVSRNLSEDAAIALGELIASQMAHAFAKKEDANGFNGTGISTSARTVGVIPSLAGLAGEIDCASGQATFATVEYDSLVNLVSALPSYALGNAKFFGHQSILTVMQNIRDDQNHPILNNFLIDGTPGFRLMGYPYVPTQVLPASTAGTQASTPFLVFGDLRQAVDLGDRQQMSIEQSDHFKFSSRTRVYLGVERIDIQMNNIGDADEAGSVAVLKTAAS
jgi:HK97 family phage major capsid protein